MESLTIVGIPLIAPMGEWICLGFIFLYPGRFARNLL
jgi:hypothetical protein